MTFKYTVQFLETHLHYFHPFNGRLLKYLHLTFLFQINLAEMEIQVQAISEKKTRQNLFPLF
jgi:hypothetical protein